ncbi:RNA polymerase sigma factor [Nocardioides sp. JQ2195]|uniref:RNA polymerase sigma factor n=1 Tax=Nocardioides sp. JQ2195 TaxID=2592334 RepID=UPI00197CCB17|nr:RNA polymerase sigma factor [Nocardioides sp. JQ2195]
METNAEVLEDAVLLHQAADGDLSAVRELYDRHAPWLTARLMRRCNDREVVVDVVQDTFLAMWRDAKKWRNDGDVAGWLWGIAFRRMVSRLRQRKQLVLLPEWDTGNDQAVPAAEDEVLLDVEYGDLGAALRRLSPEFRAVVQACVLDGLTTREASRLLGVRANTVKTRLHRAKAQLRGSLADVRLEGWQ